MFKRSWHVCIGILLVGWTLGASSQAAQIIYEQPRDPQLFETYRVWRDGQLLEIFQATVLRRFALEKSLSLSIRNCAQPNAFYNAASREVVMCWELLSAIISAAQFRFERSTYATAATSVFSFVLYHELAHALVNIHRTATFGREEDNADQIATLLFVQDDKRRSHADSNVGILAIFDFWRGGDNAYLRKHQLTGPHSPDQQRAFNVVCWAIGSDPLSRYKHLPAMTNFPSERIEPCVSEYRRAEAALRQLENLSASPR
ncbi:MAG: hypothetical protein EOO38_24900 [Cytophagaceae bacterium]|nr:MAG: hypothetical protein EOO38_24900 [Cytophagaceae bacterium]